MRGMGEETADEPERGQTGTPDAGRSVLVAMLTSFMST